MALRISAKVLIHVWAYNFYDMTLSIGKQRRHMIKPYNTFFSFQCITVPYWSYWKCMLICFLLHACFIQIFRRFHGHAQLENASDYLSKIAQLFRIGDFSIAQFKIDFYCKNLKIIHYVSERQRHFPK